MRASPHIVLVFVLACAWALRYRYSFVTVTTHHNSNEYDLLLGHAKNKHLHGFMLWAWDYQHSVEEFFMVELDQKFIPNAIGDPNYPRWVVP